MKKTISVFISYFTVTGTDKSLATALPRCADSLNLCSTLCLSEHRNVLKSRSLFVQIIGPIKCMFRCTPLLISFSNEGN